MPAPSAAAAATTSATGIPRAMTRGSPSITGLLRYSPASREKGARMPNVPVTWLGHASFRLDSPGGKRIYVDPWLGNPKCPEGEKTIERIDILALTHGHSDHASEAGDICKAHSPQVVAQVELQGWLERKGVEGLDVPGLNKGGT